MAVLVLPLVPCAIEIGNGWRIRVAGVEVADGIGLHLGYASVPEALGGVKHSAVVPEEEEAVVRDDLPRLLVAGTEGD